MARGRARTYVQPLDTESEEERMSVPDTTVTVPLAALPEARAAAEPDAPAIADDAVQLDNAAFADRVARAAALLARLGVGAGDVVAIALPNRLELDHRAVRRLAPRRRGDARQPRAHPRPRCSTRSTTPAPRS